MRLDKYISDSTAYSRRDIKKLIRAGAVSVNGESAKDAQMHVADTDEVQINGGSVDYKKHIYFMLNKPQGYVCATEDKRFPVVTELIPRQYAHYNVFPVGRLDIDTEGLLLLTNDGELAHAVISPKKNVYKRYFAKLDKPAEERDIQAFAKGMEFKEFTSKPARLEICEIPTEVYVEIAEGKFHQVKRMFERVGKTVLYLKRTAIGGLRLDESLQPGELRQCDEKELRDKLFVKNASY